MTMFLIGCLIVTAVFSAGYISAMTIHEEDRCSEIYARGFHDGYSKCIDDVNGGNFNELL